MKLLILVEIESLPDSPTLLEEMLRHLILLESIGACVLFYTTEDIAIVCSRLINLAPSIISSKTILPTLTNRELNTLSDTEVAGIKYNTVISCVSYYNDEHPDDKIQNYAQNVLVLDSHAPFVKSLTTRTFNPFTAHHVNNDTHSHRNHLARLYNTIIGQERSVLEPFKQLAEERERKLKNDQTYLRLRYQVQGLQLENLIVEETHQFLKELKQRPSLPSTQELNSLCNDHIIKTRHTLIDTYIESLGAQPEAVIKLDEDIYQILALKPSSKFDDAAVTTAMSAYIANVDRLLDTFCGALKTTDASLDRLIAEFNSYCEAARLKLDPLSIELNMFIEEIEGSIKTIDKEFNAQYGARGRGVLNYSLIYMRSETASALSSIDIYEQAFTACRAGDLVNLRRIIDSSADFDINHFHQDKTLLEVACQNAYVEIANYLVREKGAKVDLSRLIAPIFSALHGLKQYPNRMGLLELLLENGASMGPRTIDCEENTPLHVAAQQGNVRAFSVIATWITSHPYCFDPCATNKAGRTPFLEAIYSDKFCTRLPIIHVIIHVIFSLGIGISRDEVEMLRRDGKLKSKLDFMKTVAEQYALPSPQASAQRRGSVLYNGDRLNSTERPNSSDRLLRPRLDLSGSNLSSTPGENSPRDRRQSASASSLPLMQSTPRRSSFIAHTESAAAAAAAALSSTPPSTPRERKNSSLAVNLSATSVTTSVAASPSTPPATPRLDALRAAHTDSPAAPSSPRSSSGGSSTEQNRPRKLSLRNALNALSLFRAESEPPKTPLEAVRAKNPEALRRMLSDFESRKQRSVANRRRDNENTALYEAVISADKECIRCFYDSGLCLSKLEMQALTESPATNRNDIIKTLNEVIRETVQNILGESASPRPDRRRGSILSS